MTGRKVRLAVIQRICPSYRTELFRTLTSDPRCETMLFIGDSIPGTKVRNASDLRDIRHVHLNTRFFRAIGHLWPVHFGLVRALRRFSPDVIICEGESHFIGYLQAAVYRLFRRKRCALIHWCYISLPGWTRAGGGGARGAIKALMRRLFDGFLVYSSFGKEALERLGQPPRRITVATNVGPVGRFLDDASRVSLDLQGVRSALSLPNRFTILYVGELDPEKRPELMLEIARKLDPRRYNVVIIGSGVLLDALRERARIQGLDHVFVLGRITDQLPFYYAAADVLLVPGRGGIVMSEALAYGVPVVVHQADGTEYDLIEDGATGFRVPEPSAAAFSRAIELMASDAVDMPRMRRTCREFVQSKFTTRNMVASIFLAASSAMRERLACGPDSGCPSRRTVG